MGNFLFVQWKSPTDASRFVINGEVSEYSGTALQNNLMKILANVPKYKEICSSKNRNDLSPSFRCSYKKTKSSSLNVIEGNFEEKDFSGRNLVYIFATHEDDANKIVQVLKEYASLLGVTPHAEDLEEIQKKISKKKTHKIILWITLSIIVLLLLFMLLILLNKLLTTGGIQNQMS